LALAVTAGGLLAGAPRSSKAAMLPLARRLDDSGSQLLNPRRNMPVEAPSPAPSTYPGWLFGEWQLRVRPVSFAEPLGERFVDPDTHKAIREDFARGETAAGSSESGGPGSRGLGWRSRFYAPLPEELLSAGGASTSSRAGGIGIGKVVQFRAFNAAQEVRAFLGRDPPPVLTQSDPRARPLVVDLIYPVGSEQGEEALQKIQISLEASSAEAEGDSAVSSELLRQTVTTDGEVESVGDFEVITAYNALSDSHVTARCRIVQYLVPGDKLYSEADGHAVSLIDYDWDMQRLSTCIETPFGEQCRQAV